MGILGEELVTYAIVDSSSTNIAIVGVCQIRNVVGIGRAVKSSPLKALRVWDVPEQGHNERNR